VFKLNRYKKNQTKRKLELNGKKKDTHTCKRLVIEKNMKVVVAAYVTYMQNKRKKRETEG